MNYFKAMDISTSALTAQQFRIDVISQNIANATTTRTAEGTPYRRRVVVMQEREMYPNFRDVYNDKLRVISGGGVRIAAVTEDPSPLKLVHDPDHPDANEEGYVEMPNVDAEEEMVDLISASRAYEMNLTVISTFKNMALKALEIGR